MRSNESSTVRQPGLVRCSMRWIWITTLCNGPKILQSHMSRRKLCWADSESRLRREEAVVSPHGCCSSYGVGRDPRLRHMRCTSTGYLPTNSRVEMYYTAMTQAQQVYISNNFGRGDARPSTTAARRTPAMPGRAQIQHQDSCVESINAESYLL